MHNALQGLRARLIDRLGIHPHSVNTALKTTVDEYRARASHPAIARSGLTPAQCLSAAIRTPHFRASASWRALTLDGRDIDARLLWEAYLQRQASAAKRALRAVPRTAVLGNPDALRCMGRQLGLDDEQTEQLVLNIAVTVRSGYPYRPASLRHLTFPELLAEIPADQLAAMLQLAARQAENDDAQGYSRRDQ
ncbi:hypothetical protein [Streptomyces sp. MNP-20]|uniref:hypothetical protein n=1 Tax=Streptomyces sp. MNP-20 TaxID=2721165 RepID=UPI001552633E|nr:hypothetical protein [Streptomyces sp. MNP-20]